jgi:hypothetical protein
VRQRSLTVYRGNVVLGFQASCEDGPPEIQMTSAAEVWQLRQGAILAWTQRSVVEIPVDR